MEIPFGANPNSGVNIGTVSAGSSLTVTFQVIVTSTPPSNPITNVASIQFAFIVDPAAPPVTGTVTSNSASTQINNATVTTLLEAIEQSYLLEISLRTLQH